MSLPVLFDSEGRSSGFAGGRACKASLSLPESAVAAGSFAYLPAAGC